MQIDMNLEQSACILNNVYVIQTDCLKNLLTLKAPDSPPPSQAKVIEKKKRNLF